MKLCPGRLAPLCILILSIALSSCTKAGTAASPSGVGPSVTVDKETPSVDSEEPPEASKGAWDLEFEALSLRLVASIVPPVPFPAAIEVGSSTLSFSWPDGKKAAYNLDGSAAALASSTRFTLPVSTHPGEKATASRGRLTYTVEGSTLTVAGGRDLPAPWKAPVPLVSNPVLAGSRILVATSRPSFALLDRKGLSLIAEYPVTHRISGPLAIVEGRGGGTSLLLAGHTDGSFGLYDLGLPPGSAPRAAVDDPSLLLSPPSATLDPMRAKLSELLGGIPVAGPLPVWICTSKSRLEASGPWLFLIESTSDAWLRIGVEGVREDFLLAFFAADGAFLSSNLDYSAERHLDLKGEPGRFYYAAVGLKGGGAPKSARFVVGPRK